MQRRFGERVVEGVAADLVGGFEHGRRHDVAVADGARRQQGAEHLGGKLHPLGTGVPDEGVLVRALGRDHHGEQRGERPPARQRGRGEGGLVDGQYSEPLRAVEKREPRGDAAAGRGLLHPQRLRAVRPARQGVVHRERRRDGRLGDEAALLDVDEVDDGVPQPERLGGPRRGGTQVQGEVGRIGEEPPQRRVARIRVDTSPPLVGSPPRRVMLPSSLAPGSPPRPSGRSSVRRFGPGRRGTRHHVRPRAPRSGAA